MPYRIRTARPVGGEVARIAREQIDRALAETTGAGLDPDAVVYQLRKRCKKIRALLRLVREPLDEAGLYTVENQRYRDIARRLSGARDAAVLLKTCDALLARYDEEIEAARFMSLRNALVQRAGGQGGSGMACDLRQIGLAFREGRAAVDRWAERIDGFASLEGGLRETYARGRKAMRKAYRRAGPEQFHAWRKFLKYHWYHCRLLHGNSPAGMRGRRDVARRLASLLGAEHDLTVFMAVVGGESFESGDEAARVALLTLADRRREQLRARAAPLGRRLYADTPAQFVGRLRRCWPEVTEAGPTV